MKSKLKLYIHTESCEKTNIKCEVKVFIESRVILKNCAELAFVYFFLTAVVFWYH